MSSKGRVAQLYPRHWVPILVASYDTHGVRWGYSNARPPHGKIGDFTSHKWSGRKQSLPCGTPSLKLLHCLMKIKKWINICAECMVKTSKTLSAGEFKQHRSVNFHYVMIFPVLTTNKGMLKYITQGLIWTVLKKNIKGVVFCKTLSVKWTDNFWDIVNFIRWNLYFMSQTVKQMQCQINCLLVTDQWSFILQYEVIKGQICKSVLFHSMICDGKKQLEIYISFNILKV
jgi:hypothetical protein